MRHDYPLTLEVPKGWRGDAAAGQEAGGTAAAYPRHCEGKFPFLNDKLSDQVALISLLEPSFGRVLISRQCFKLVVL